jgi:DNA-binding NtrC family response regulator
MNVWKREGAALRAPEEAGCGAPITAGEARILGLVGESGPMRALFAQIENVAVSETAAHIFGETGTGKEGTARAIHALSARAQGPFVAVNAATLTGELFDSLVFGHVKGSFSGAVNDHPGYVAEAEGGILFIDEVVDLSLGAQARLLRFLQEKVYRRLGDTRDRRANVRVVTAANVPLDVAVAAGRFRADLRYRLGCLQLALPPLRERGEDVILLARHLLRKIAQRDKVPVPRLPPEVEAALRAYTWPGNVREMENVMNQLLVFSRGRAIRFEDLSLELRTPGRPVHRRLDEARRTFEREHVQDALRRTDGNRTRAAFELGITRQALYEKLRRFGL